MTPAGSGHDGDRSAGFGLGSRRVGDAHIITLGGRLDADTCPALTKELEHVEGTDADHIIVDLSGLTFMDKSGLAVLLSANQRSCANGDRLVLLRGPRAVHRVFELTGTDTWMTFLDQTLRPRPADPSRPANASDRVPRMPARMVRLALAGRRARS